MSDRIEIWFCDACGAVSMEDQCPTCGLPRSGEATEILAEFFEIPTSDERPTPSTPEEL